MWWPPGPVTGGPQRITVERTDGAPARDVARGISTTVLRRLDIAAAVKLAEQVPELDNARQALRQEFDESAERAGRLLAEEGVSERYLAVLAATYKQLADAGDPAPVRRLARLVGRRPETIKDHLKKARREEYLGTVAGKAGGELTDKTRAILNSMHDGES